MAKTKIVLASANPSKLAELRYALRSYGVAVEAASIDKDTWDKVETADTFQENAILKALFVDEQLRAAKKADAGTIVLADDSGLCVDALAGAPGVYSARFALRPRRGRPRPGPGATVTDADNRAELVRRMREVGVTESDGRYVCTVAYMRVGGHVEAETATWSVLVKTEGRGNGGFAYDRHCWLGEMTVAELNDEEKDQLSHRGRAVRAAARRFVR